MGQQIRKVTKRRRRIEYLKRKKEQSKLNSNAPIRLAVPVAKDAKPAAKEAPAKKTAAKAPAKRLKPRLPPPRRPPLKSRLPRRPLNPPPNNCPGGGFPSVHQSDSFTSRRAIAWRFFLHVRASCIFPEREEVARLSR